MIRYKLIKNIVLIFFLFISWLQAKEKTGDTVFVHLKKTFDKIKTYEAQGEARFFTGSGSCKCEFKRYRVQYFYKKPDSTKIHLKNAFNENDSSLKVADANNRGDLHFSLEYAMLVNPLLSSRTWDIIENHNPQLVTINQTLTAIHFQDSTYLYKYYIDKTNWTVYKIHIEDEAESVIYNATFHYIQHKNIPVLKKILFDNDFKKGGYTFQHIVVNGKKVDTLNQ